MKAIKAVVCAIVFVAALVGGYYLYGALSDEGAPSTTEAAQTQTSETATDIIFYDTDGKEVSLSSFLGKPVVLNFWATWCSPCKQELPHFQTAYDKYGDRVQFLLVNIGPSGNDSLEQAQSLFSSNGYSIPIYIDGEDGTASATYGVQSIPQTFFIDAEGNRVDYRIGAMDSETLEGYINKIL